MSEGLLNTIKGFAYEEYVKTKLVDENNNIWLWKECPVEYLIQSKLINSYNEHRIYRKSVKNKEEHTLIDTGIDIIKLKDNEFTMIQCKNYKNSIQISDLAGFWFMACNYPQHLYEVYYTSKLSSNLTLHNINQRILYTKQDFPFDEIEYTLNNIPNKKYIVDEYFKKCKEEKIKLKKKIFVIEENENKIEKRQYQQDAIKDISNELNKNSRAILSLPCGLGKTYIAYEVAIKYEIIILFSPLMQHAKQNLDRFILYNSELKCQLVDSDNLGTRNIDKLKKFINDDGKKFLFSTYKSSDIIFELYHNYKDKNALIIIDEFHNLTLKNIIDEKDYIYKLLNTDIKIMSMSATARVYELEKEEIDITGLLGEIAYSMPFTDAVKDKLVCDYQIYLPLIAEDVKENHDNIKKEININQVNLSVLDKCSFMCCSIIDLGFRHMICYFQDIKEIDEFIETLKIADEYYALDNLLVDKITCDTKQKDRENIINKFKNHDGVSILCSVKILDECIDIKECDSVFVTYPCKNKVKMVQRLNRCTRINKTKPNKKGGLLLWCDENDDIAYTMSSLKEYDPELVTKVNVRNKDSNIVRKDNKKIVENQVGQTTKYIVGIKVFNMMKWDEWHKLLLEFVEKNGRMPEEREKYKDKNISKWLGHQKEKIKTLSNDIYIKLSKNEIIKNNLDNYLINKEKNKDKIKLTWDEWYKLLIEYVNIHNKIPSSEEKYKTYKLGDWFQNQKGYINNTEDIKYKNFSTNILVKESLDNFLDRRNLKIQHRNDKINIEQKFELLYEFVEKYKKIPSEKDNYKYFNLGKFFKHIKEKIINKDNELYIKLSSNIILKRALDNYLEPDLIWNNNKNLLFSYCDQYKKIPVDSDKNVDYKKISLWFQNQKSNITTTTDEKYIKLSKNTIVKQSLDNNLKIKEEKKNKEKITFEQYKKLLFSF